MSGGPAGLAGRRLAGLRTLPRALRALPRSLRSLRGRPALPARPSPRGRRSLPALIRARPALSPRLRRRLLAIFAACLVLTAGYQFWLRDSSLVAVEQVTVTGLTTSDADRVRLALTAAGRDMTTLNVDRELLDRAVAAYPVVRGLEVTSDFPHGLRVRVLEHDPAAMAVGDGGELPVAGDGTILRGLPVERRLPTVEVDGVFGAERLRDPTARAAAAVAGAAPAVLRSRVDEVAKRSGEGLVAELREGPELIFGSASRLPAKWAAAARVLADPEAQGASYIDLRIPSRPAAGGLPAETVEPVAPAGLAPSPVIPPADGTVPPAGATVPPAEGTVPPAAATVSPSDPSATAPTAPTAPGSPLAGTPPPAAPTPPAPVTGGAEGGAAAPAAP